MEAASIVIAADVDRDAELPQMANILATTPIGNGSDMFEQGGSIPVAIPIAQMGILLSQTYQKKYTLMWLVGAEGSGHSSCLTCIPISPDD